MPEGFARVAAVSVPVHLGDVQANVNEILAAMETLEKKGVQVAVFPELCLTGATLGDLLLRPELQKKAWKGLAQVAQKTGKMAVVVGLPVGVRGRLYNCAAVVQDGCAHGLVPQISPLEKRWFVSGEDVYEELMLEGDLVVLSPDQLFEAGDCVFGVEVGQDVLLPNAPGVRLMQLNIKI